MLTKFCPKHLFGRLSKMSKKKMVNFIEYTLYIKEICTHFCKFGNNNELL